MLPLVKSFRYGVSELSRLEGSTWYVIDLGPSRYWKFFGDAILHRIHRRVLEHVRDLSET